jgi:6-phosphogluconate dehydrogenase
LLKAASEEKGYGLDLAEITRIWSWRLYHSGGGMLNEIKTIFDVEPCIANILFADAFTQIIRNEQGL